MEDEKRPEIKPETDKKSDSEKDLCGCLAVDECGCIEDACELEQSACNCFADPCACQLR